MHDLSIIGSGWAGFNAALKARELGLKVCIIEKEEIGGTCLNRGCIPTKTLIQSARVYAQARKSTGFGIELSPIKADLNKIQERKIKIISSLQSGMHSLLKGIDFVKGRAQIISNEEVAVAGEREKTKNILIAVGSRPIELNRFKFDGRKIISSDQILNLKEIPRDLLIIGGGVIGCEFANLFSSLGTRVTITEKMPQLIPGEDRETAKKLELIFKKKGIKINTNREADPEDTDNYSLILVCIGRAPDTENMNLEKIGIKLDKGKILVDEYLKTNLDNIYAAGDCTGKIMLAHFAAYQGKIAAQNLANPSSPTKIDESYIPSCIFTDPEIASVGLNEETAANKGLEINVNRFDFQGSGMARILDETEGFIKIISEKKTNKILGASIIGPKATELIGILTLAASNNLDVSRIKNTIFAHPTISESINEAFKS